MPNAPDIYERIRSRRAEIARLRAELEREEADLAVTERVVARFLPDQGFAAIGEIATEVVAEAEPPTKHERHKPEGVPSVMRMAMDILRESAADGNPWVETALIVERIRKRWWPEAEASQITPQLWRAAAKKGTLLKDGTRYALPHAIEKGPAASAIGPSQADGAEVSACKATSVPAGGVNGLASDLARHQSTAN